MKKGLSQQERFENFVKKAREVHRDKYLYEDMNYVNSSTPIGITCPVHGVFYQTPSAHIRGNNCPKCGNIKRGDAFRSTYDDFKKHAREVHGDRYIYYDDVDFTGLMDRIRIGCKVHGDFEIIAMNHIVGQGCPKCAGKYRTTEDVIKIFREVHGDKYDYSKVDFKKMNEKVCIICPEHGEFWQTPTKHKKGQGCPRCGKVYRKNPNGITYKGCVEKAKVVHNGFYEYPERPKHGDFEQIAGTHLKGCGCPSCAKQLSKGENEIYEYVCYLAGEEKVERKNRKLLNGKIRVGHIYSFKEDCI